MKTGGHQERKKSLMIWHDRNQLAMCGKKMENRDKGQDIIKDSAVLVFVRLITLSVSIIQTMILSRTLTKAGYGTYSQAVLIISFSAPLFSLGLGEAVNYFFNRAADKEVKESAINTIFLISIISGLACGLLIWMSQRQIAGYFGNAAVLELILLIAFRPCLQNLIALYQPLYISSGYAGAIAVRNLLVSIAQVGVVSGASYFWGSMERLFLLLLLLDMIQLFCFGAVYRKRQFAISVFRADFSLIGRILRYALPMLLAASLSTISINIDQLMVSGLMGTEHYALYSNVSRELPFAVVISSFTAVVTPLVIRYINAGEHQRFKDLWSSYMEMGYRVTWPLCVGAAVMAPEMIEVLYSEAYLNPDGVMVFRIYTVAAMLRFTYFGMIPTALGRTDVVLKYSGISCLINVCLNYPMYLLLGLPGPAAATVASMVIGALLYFRASARLVNISLWEVLDVGRIARFMGQMAACGVAVRAAVSMVEKYHSDAFIDLMLGYLVFNVVIFIWNLKSLKILISVLRKESQECY